MLTERDRAVLERSLDERIALDGLAATYCYLEGLRLTVSHALKVYDSESWLARWWARRTGQRLIALAEVHNAALDYLNSLHSGAQIMH